MMLTRAAVVLFILSNCLTEGSNSCPSACKCGDRGREVDCSGKELEEIPELIFNNISVPVPPNSSVWERRLNVLHLSNNNIKKVVKSNFQRLPKLMHVYLDYNLISVIDPYAFERNDKLWKLTLSGNELTIPEDIPFLIVPSLGRIELANCSISDMPISFFRNMSNLEFIRLSDNKIEKLDSELFSHLKKLRRVHLEGNQIKHVDPVIFKTNHRLHWLYLSRNPFDNFNGIHFLNSSSLISLDISFCNISKIPDKFFSNLHDLVSLNLRDNRLQSFNMKAVPQTLEALDISGNSLTAVNMTTEMIRLLDSLRHLDLTNNSFTCKCRELDLWKWCEKLRTGNGGASSCAEFCPNPCGEPEKPDGGKTEIGNVRTGMGIIPGKTSMEPETSDNGEHSDVEIIKGHNVSREDANDTLGRMRVIDGHESEGSAKMWNIIMYTCIGVFGALCLIGAIALATDTILGCRKSRDTEVSRAPSRNSLQNVRLELMDPIEDRQETTPLTHHRGFDFVMHSTNVHRNPQPGPLRHS